MKNKTSFALLLLLLLLQVSACGINDQPTPSLTPVISTEVSKSATTSAATVEPATLTPTPTIIPSLTFTPDPRPTLSSQEREAYLLEYFSNPSECKLPCWLGIIPGTTSFAEFQATIHHLGLNYSPRKLDLKSRHQVSLGGLDLESRNVLNRIILNIEPGGTIGSVEGILHAYLDPESFATVWETLDIEQILLNYGKPSSISILTDYNNVAGRVGYTIRVYYIEEGFAIYYNGGADYQDETKICPQLKDYQLITVAFSLQSPPFKEKISASRSFDTELDTGLSMDALYELFTDPTGTCLKVPADLFN